jgi:hypothetical protein
MAVMIQKVAYSDKLGVFLGIKEGLPVWSKDIGLTGKELAPTFQDRPDLERYLESEFKKVGPTSVAASTATALAGCRLQEVWPRQDGGMAGVEEIANSGLPRWGNG